MAIHNVQRVVLGVPNLEQTAGFYRDFGLEQTRGYVFSTVDGGEQLELVHSPKRRLVRATFGAESPEDLEQIASSLREINVRFKADDDALLTQDPGTGTGVTVTLVPSVRQALTPTPLINGPGRLDRINARAAGLLREGRVRPRRLGHFVLGTTNYDATWDFFTRGLGFRVSDLIKDFGAFLRCSEDHHNVLIQRAPVPFIHHTSWQVDDVDEIGRGAMHMLEGHPERHVWGLGRHYAGSNFFWYLKDPAGNFAEYHSDMDCIPADAIWTPETLDGARGLFMWGPPPPASFINPEDLAELMIGGHTA